MKPDFDAAYKTAIEYRNGERDLLFERLNYFLVGTAFLATAYATLVIEQLSHPSNTIFYLAWLINGVGFYLSVFFAIINNLNSKILIRLDCYIHNFEIGSIHTYAPFTHIHDNVIKQVFEDYFHNNTLEFIAGPITGVVRYFREPFDQREAFVPYFVPLGFAIFWAIAFFFILQGHILLKILYFLPLIVVIVWGAYHMANNKWTRFECNFIIRMAAAILVALVPLILEIFKLRIPIWSIVLIEVVALLIIGIAFFTKKTKPDTTIETEPKIATNENQVKETEAAKTEDKIDGEK